MVWFACRTPARGRRASTCFAGASWLECGTTDRMQAGPMASNWYKGGVDGHEPSLGDCAAHVLEVGRVVLTDSSTTKDGGGEWNVGEEDARQKVDRDEIADPSKA
ncbi:unnamed protein product [Fusarium venenatum]|uniref:Uncharacterized protein n=1 Tax=Fusarium venenatum TaxID=56646 RepID=A0A2L2SQD3_9HYPO|nr:uncharacterized protein FVRRES_12957 [Fusarium venenatum]CEI40266.1 unnamed protein product [Fusarium venenatum]